MRFEGEVRMRLLGRLAEVLGLRGTSLMEAMLARWEPTAPGNEPLRNAP